MLRVLANRLLKVVLERLGKPFRETVERGQRGRFALDLFVGAIEALPRRNDYEGEQQPVKGADDAEGKAGDLVIAFEA